MNSDNTYVFSQLHIDVARNSTDDFNLFHDSKNWHKIKQNPFQGPKTLGFQLESLIEDKIAEFRHQADEQDLIDQHSLHFSNYQFSFTIAIKAGQVIEVEIKPSQLSPDLPLCSAIA